MLAGWHIRMDQVAPAMDGEAMDWIALDADRDERGFIRRIAAIYWHYRNSNRAEPLDGTRDPSEPQPRFSRS